jgi:amino acid transporter
MSSAPVPSPVNGPSLTRALSLWNLVVVGIILIQPTAPMPVYGVVSQEAHGHVVTTILISMVAMLFTAISFGRMARAYPSAGSAFTYVAREVHPAAGYAIGWSMALEYILNPLICVVWSAKAALNIWQAPGYAVWAVFFACLFTFLNLRGIRSSARINEWMAAGMGLVIFAFLVMAVRYVLRLPHLDTHLFTTPFYDPKTYSTPALFTGTSVAVLTYIGFDGISTLSEEVHNPRRNILLATVLVLLFTGVSSAVQVYAAQLIWPQSIPFPDVDTAFVHVAGRAGGVVLFQLVNLTLLVATIGSGAGSQLAAARLLYGMGRDNALPKSFFGAIEPIKRIPRNNIVLVGALALAGAFVFSYQLGAEMLNFGAFIAFMGVNAAAFVRYFLRAEKKTWSHLAPPVLGFLICLYIFCSLRTPPLLGGLAWMVLGIAYGAWKTSGFRKNLVTFEVPSED